MKNNLKDQMKKHYSSKELNQNQLDNLKNLQKEKYNFVFDIRKAAASLAVACVILFVVITKPYEAVDIKIAKEVRYNHKKNMPSEVLSGEYAIINEALDRLNFKVKESAKIKAIPTMALMGARYCSVQGEIAAQLHFKDIATNKRYTMYQFKLGEDHKIPNQSSISKENIKVQIWTEDGVGFAMAEDL